MYVCITSIRTYAVALDAMLLSLPHEWRNKYIIVYQKEPYETHKIFLDGHIEVSIKQNLHDYGNYVGINLLIKKGIVEHDAWFLFVHDTCKFGKYSAVLANAIINNINMDNYDIIWLCDNGQCNLSFVRKNAVIYGCNIYDKLVDIDKVDTIKYEWEHTNKFIPKSLHVNQYFIKIASEHKGKRFVYNNVNERDVLYYLSLDMEKYYYYVDLNKETKYHPHSP